MKKLILWDIDGTIIVSHGAGIRAMEKALTKRFGATCDLRQIDEDEQISVSVLGEDAGRTVSRLEVSQIIEARMRETFELLRNEIRAAGVGMLPAGVILTGGNVDLDHLPWG